MFLLIPAGIVAIIFVAFLFGFVFYLQDTTAIMARHRVTPVVVDDVPFFKNESINETKITFSNFAMDKLNSAYKNMPAFTEFYGFFDLRMGTAISSDICIYGTKNLATKEMTINKSADCKPTDYSIHSHPAPFADCYPSEPDIMSNQGKTFCIICGESSIRCWRTETKEMLVKDHIMEACQQMHRDFADRKDWVCHDWSEKLSEILDHEGFSTWVMSGEWVGRGDHNWLEVYVDNITIPVETTSCELIDYGRGEYLDVLGEIPD